MVILSNFMQNCSPGAENNPLTENTQHQSQTIEAGYTRVTSVLYPFTGLSTVDPWIVESAANRGTRVHTACESIVKGFGNWDHEHDIFGYVNSFCIWWRKQKVIEIEKRFYCRNLMITGQVDMIMETDVGNVILDIKTSSKPSKTWPLQGSAYAYMARKAGYDIQGIQFLHLNKRGDDPVLIQYDENFDTFKKCLDVYRYFYDPNRLKGEK